MIMRALAGAAFIAVISAAPATAQELNLDGSLTARSIQLFVAITALSLVPALAIMFTCFPFMVTVLSILRQGLGLQQSPPNMLLVSLALFLTYFVMEPVFQTAWQQGVDPMIQTRLEVEDAAPLIISPFRDFMEARIDPDTLQNLIDLRPGLPPDIAAGDAPMAVILPAFMLSEMTRAFEIGFLIFLPFLIVDLVVAAVLMSMGMMMVPPAMVAMPFKLAFFVVADGWSLIAGALVTSYG